VDFTVRNPKRAAEIFATVADMSRAETLTTLHHEQSPDYFSRGRLDPEARRLVIKGTRIGDPSVLVT